MVAPAEIEAYLMTHPKVMQAFVIGVPDPRLNEAAVAYVIPRAGEAPTEAELAILPRQDRVLQGAARRARRGRRAPHARTPRRQGAEGQAARALPRRIEPDPVLTPGPPADRKETLS